MRKLLSQKITHYSKLRFYSTDMKKHIGLALIVLISLAACKQGQSQNDNQPVSEELKKIDRENAQSVIRAGDQLTKMYVFLPDSLLDLRGHKIKDHRIFGYEKPDTLSKRLLLFSVFTNDVEGNPYGFEMGAHYELPTRTNLRLKYLSHDDAFVEALAIDSANTKRKVYFETSWVVIESEDDADSYDDETLNEFGLIENIEDGAYPFFVVTVEFVERQMKINFNLNIESVPMDVNQLYEAVGKYASIDYTSELEKSLLDLHYDGSSVFGEYAPEFDSEWNKFSGLLSGADQQTAGDLPDTITITAGDGQKMNFESFIDADMVKANGKTVDVYYYQRGVNTIVGLEVSED